MNFETCVCSREEGLKVRLTDAVGSNTQRPGLGCTSPHKCLSDGGCGCADGGGDAVM